MHLKRQALRTSGDRSDTSSMPGALDRVPTISDQKLERLARFAAIAFACTRPTVIGSLLSAPVCAVMLLIGIAIVFRLGKSRLKPFRDDTFIVQLGILTFLALYNFVLGTFIPYRENPDAIKGLGISAATISTLAIIGSRRRIFEEFFDTYAFIIILSSLSLIITFGLDTIGIHARSLALFQIPISGYNDQGGIVAFPLTTIANEVDSWSGGSTRLSGIFREPGAFPPFACWAAAYASLRGWRPWFIVAPLVASIMSLSTIGPLALFTGACLFLYKMRLSPILAILIIGAGGVMLWPVIYNLEYIGIAAKIAAKTGSYEDREGLILGALNTNDVLFGDGNEWASFAGANAGGNLLAQFRDNGAVFVLPIVIFYLLALRDLRLWIAGCLPGCLAIMTSQGFTLDNAFTTLFFGWIVFTKDQLPIAPRKGDLVVARNQNFRRPARQGDDSINL